LALGNAAGLARWGYLVVVGRHKDAFLIQIALFPFTFYTARAFGISAFTTPDGEFDQRLGLTTALLFAILIAVIAGGEFSRSRGTANGVIEALLWVFSIGISASQFLTHSKFAAVLLSIGAGWQWLALYYVMTSLVRNQNDVMSVLNAVFVMSLLNVVVRVVAKGESLIINPASQLAGQYEGAGTFGAEAGRVGSGALGPAVSYAGYLAMLITLALAMAWITRKAIYTVYAGAMAIELLNTFTRGGIYVMVLLAILLAFRATRMRLGRSLLIGFALGLPLISLVSSYLAVRGVTANPAQISNFTNRLELLRLFFADYYRPTISGTGILKDTVIALSPWFAAPVHSAYVEILDTCGPLPFVTFTLLSFSVLWISWRAYRRAGRRTLRARMWSGRVLLPCFIVALTQWMVFANTSGTSVLAYYPYEGTAIFWIVSFLALTTARSAVRLRRPRTTSSYEVNIAGKAENGSRLAGRPIRLPAHPVVSN